MPTQRNPIIRQHLLEIFQSADHPQAAGEVLSQIQQIKSSVNKTTIYRDLEKLVNEKILNSVVLVPGVTHYELSSLGHHHHLVCTDCQTIRDIPCPDFENNHLSSVEKQLKAVGFNVQTPQITYQGLCVNCNK